jgi:rhodanese-related sulfurtransferase
MPTSIHRRDVVALVTAGAQLVEVLPQSEYDEEHLPGAIHLPLKSLTRASASVLDASQPVVVYCWDALCDMSPRAAWRLEEFGFEVSDYTTGKADWRAAGLPTEGRGTPIERAVDAMRTDVLTCRLEITLTDVQRAMITAGATECIVINDSRVVIGRLRYSAVEAAGDKTIDNLVEPGPTTIRADADLIATRQRLQERRVASVLVTTPDGELLGALDA